MRRMLLALPLIAACSTPQAIVATKDPTPETPTAKNALAAARTLRFAFDVSHEISCSQSFETNSTWGSYVLTLTPPHAATLVFERVESHTFGSSRFDSAAEPPNHTEKRSTRHFEGTVVQTGSALTVTLSRAKTDCAEGESCTGTLTLACDAAKADVVTFDAKGKHVTQHPIVRCSPGYGLPIELDKGGWKGELAFADDSGFYLDYPEYGPMEHPPELRPAP
jgi:hypothetical protein